MSKLRSRKKLLLTLGGVALIGGFLRPPTVLAQQAGGAPSSQGFTAASGRCLGEYQSAPRAQDGATCATCSPTTGDKKDKKIVEITPSNAIWNVVTPGNLNRCYASGVLTQDVIIDLPGSNNACLEAHTGEVGQDAGLGGCDGTSVGDDPPDDPPPPPPGPVPKSNGPGP